MVDKADVVVCAFNGKSGGTAYTVDYALKQNKIVIQINPETSEVCAGLRAAAGKFRPRGRESDGDQGSLSEICGDAERNGHGN